MGQLETAGPQVGLTVIYQASPTSFYPALITSVNQTTGLVQLTTFPPGGTTANVPGAQYDATGTISGSWRFPDIGTGI